jgi:hypothetical protein
MRTWYGTFYSPLVLDSEATMLLSLSSIEISGVSVPEAAAH